MIAALGTRGVAAAASICASDAARIAHATPQAALLPWLLPSLPRTPLLLLTDEQDSAQIAALDAGADDAVPASASDALIAARLLALLRRKGEDRYVQLGPLCIDTLERRAMREGRPIALLPREYQLLLELARAGGALVSRKTLLERVCGLRIDPGTNVLEVHVSRLRAKLDRGFAAPMLVTEKGKGYRLATPPAFAVEAQGSAR
ncbi:winged helix-turn-helix domain-containing protein [Sphingomonas sp.]|uniref:winged helix-turn-helix domain-containing protein n=1 Tax=Sphingomonas sp. TaxID=28214 RepID=UPI0025FF91CA|nr:winged helix-turn-helix domain-containing protein [Sphingomonas sp.]